MNETTQLESETREIIDQKYIRCGWEIQDKKRINLMSGDYGVHGIAVREMDTDTCPADYMLFIVGKACKIVEAKREGTNLGKVTEESTRYANSSSKHIERCVKEGHPLSFLYEVTNNKIQ